MNFQTSTLSKKHAIVIAILIALGIGGAAAILLIKQDAPAGDRKASSEHAEGGHQAENKTGKAEDEQGHAKGQEEQEGHGEHGEDDGDGEQEGTVAMSDEQVKAAGITFEAAGPADLKTTLQLPGEIRFNEDRTAHVVPRVSGVVESVSVNLGQRVRKGQVLAVIGSAEVSEQRSEFKTAQKRLQLARATYEREKTLWEEKISPQQDVQQAEQALREAEIAVGNASEKLRAIGAANTSSGGLSRFELRAPFDGTIVEKHLAIGESVRDDANVMTLSDLSNVWAEVSVSAKDLNQVRVGSKVTVRSTAFNESATGTVAYLGSLLGEQTRTAKARIKLANPNGAWRPGLFVTIELVTAEVPAPVTVVAQAVQQLDNKSVVYLKVPGGFVPQSVELGRNDGKHVEVVSGLKAGTTYVAAGSFMVKSEAGKGSVADED